jgi:hypothetical protein
MNLLAAEDDESAKQGQAAGGFDESFDLQR